MPLVEITMESLPMNFTRKLLAMLFVLSLGAVLVSGCSGGTGETSAHAYPMAPLSDMPAEVSSAPVVVQEAYQFAVANPDVLEELPCYCGCGAMGHTSNYACYVAGEDSQGGLVIDNHALGCSICVDITQDAMRMLEEGKSVPEIRAYVDQTYAQFGPSNMP